LILNEFICLLNRRTHLFVTILQFKSLINNNISFAILKDYYHLVIRNNQL